MGSKKQFGGLWGDEDAASAPKSTNLSGTRFSTRDYAVDQSVNLMAMGEAPATNLSGSSRSSGLGLASSVAGLFRGSTTGTEPPPQFDEYGDAAASTESEEYISDKQRRMTPVVASIRNFVTTKSFFALLLGVFGCAVLGGGIYLAATKTTDQPNAEIEMQNFIVNSFVTHKSVFEGTSSNSQKRAIQWLAHEDPAKLSPKDKGFLDRYILAVFYFGSNDKQEGWKNNENWMTAKGVCSWAGVKCVPKSVTPASSNNFQSETQTYDENDSIVSLMLPDNNIEGVLPEELAGFPHLLTIDLSNNDISGPIPTQLGLSKTIRDLILSNNSIVGTFPTELTKLKSLHQLYLSGNKMEGHIPESIQEMVNLRSLSLSSNLFGGKFPHLQTLNLLLTLHLDDNQFEGLLPNFLVSLTDLKDLRISKNEFIGAIPHRLGSLANLEVLHMDQNKLTGTIPDFFRSSPRIADLRLHRNQLHGPIPSSLWDLFALKHLSLDNNKLTGSIGNNLGSLADVSVVSLHLNQLTGSIPSSIGFLDDITTLTLNSNKLSGSIPAQLGDCFRLQRIDIDQNQLTGEIPSELGKLDRLQEFRLEINLLDKVVVPPELCDLTDNEQLTHLSADCKKKVTCECCTQCL